MPFGSPSRQRGMLFGTVVVCLLLFFLLTPRAQAFPELIVTVGDTIGPAGQQNSVITVYLDNFVDEVAGFTLWLHLSEQNIARFQVDTQVVIDSTWWRLIRCDTCVTAICDTIIASKCYIWVALDPNVPPISGDSLEVDTTIFPMGSVATAGTLIQDWDLVQAYSTNQNATDLYITAWADYYSTPGAGAPIPAGQQGGMLIKLLADIQEVPDTLTKRTAVIEIDRLLDKLIFSRPDGTAIGISSYPQERTYCWQCETWNGGTCTDSVKVSDPPCDWTTLDTIDIPFLDTSKFYAFDGSISVEEPPPTCCIGTTGNVNMNGIVDLGDLALLVSFLTNPPATKPVLPCFEEANVNGSGIIDLGDLALLVAFLTNPPATKPVLPNCPE